MWFACATSKGDFEVRHLILIWFFFWRKNNNSTLIENNLFVCFFHTGIEMPVEVHYTPCNHEHERTDENGEQHRCDHAPLTAQEQKKRMWIIKGSMAFQSLPSLVLEKRLLRDMEKMTLFKHTGENSCLCTLDYLTGQARFNQVFCTRSKQWVLKKIFIPHTTQFIDKLIKKFMDRRCNPNIQFTMPTSSLALPQPALPPNIAPVPKPSKEAATTSFQSRF